MFAADDFSKRHFQMYFFLGALRINKAQTILWLCSLINAFVIRRFGSSIVLAYVATSEISFFKLAIVAKLAYLSMAWSDSPDTFFRVEVHIYEN